jgi:predicted dehydrogenase
MPAATSVRKAEPARTLRRALFVGLGGVGQRHLRNLRALLGDSVNVDAYRVRRENAVLDDQLRVVDGAGLEERYGVEPLSTLEAALARQPDVVFVTNPSSLHVPVALSAAEAGADLFVEKPLSHSLADVDALAQTVERRGLVGFVAYQLRRHPGFSLLRQRLTENVVGRPLSVRAEVGEFLPGFHPYEDYRRMYAAQRALGGGVTLSQIHELDYLVALFGRPERAFAMGGKVSSLELDVDDLTSALIEFRVQGRPLVVELHQDFFQRPSHRRCTVIGDAGRMEWSLSERYFRRWDAEGKVVEDVDYAEYPRNQAFIDELSYFLDCVADRRQPDIGIRDGAESLKLALALLESQKTGAPQQFVQEGQP